MAIYLSTEDLLALVDDLGGGPVRDVGLLSSAAHRPTTTLWGKPAYASVDEQAAALLESIVRGHPLVDGSKRLGWLALVVFLGLNGIDLDAPDDDAYDLVVAIATGDASVQAVAGTLRHWRGVA